MLHLGGGRERYIRVPRTFSLGHLEALPEHQRYVAGLTACSCLRRAQRGKMLRLIYDLDETVSKRLWWGEGNARVTKVSKDQSRLT